MAMVTLPLELVEELCASANPVDAEAVCDAIRDGGYVQYDEDRRGRARSRVIRVTTGRAAFPYRRRPRRTRATRAAA